MDDNLAVKTAKAASISPLGELFCTAFDWVASKLVTHNWYTPPCIFAPRHGFSM